MPRRRCKFEHVYGDSTYRWNLNPLCKEGSGYIYNGSKALGQQFFFNICGNTSVSCSDYSKRVPEYESHGAATQFFQVSRGTRNNGGCLREDNTSCTDYTFGGDTCCSVRRCEVVAYNIFTFDVLSRTDPSAGVVLTYAGYPDRNDDDFGCPEQAPGLKRLRSVVLTLQCDPAGAANDLQITDYNEESPYCTFRVTARTRAACGVADAPAAPAAAAAAAAGVGPGGQFGFVVLGGCLVAAAVALAPVAGRRLRAAGVQLPDWLAPWLGQGASGPRVPMMAAASASPSTPLFRK